MSINQNSKIYKHTVNYSGLAIELVSDNIQLIEINFVKEKKIKVSENVSDPVMKAVLFLDDYFHGKKSKIEIVLMSEFLNVELKADPEKLYLNMSGYTAKEIQVYMELLKVKPGEKVSYSDLAIRSGIPRGARFAGNCMAGNRFPVIIPCHRVLKADGSIGNYTGGVGIKELLLKHEKENLF